MMNSQSLHIIMQGLNIFFFVFHTVFTIFNLFGWIFRKTRIAHLVTMSLTSFSWFILGIFYGPGFCFCTEWHMQARRYLGYRDSSRSYVHLLLETLLPWSVNEAGVIEATKWAYILIVICMAAVRIPDIVRKHTTQSQITRPPHIRGHTRSSH